MKTSFYFVLWILIYPILGLLHNDFVDNNAFIIALGIVWGLSWLLNQVMPETLTYERASQVAPILEDVYTGNVSAFMKRLSRESDIELVTAIYFVVTTLVIALAVFKLGVDDWISLAIFSFFTIGAVSRSFRLIKAKSMLRHNPTAEQCMEIAQDTYNMDYVSYYNERNDATYAGMLPPKPRHFKVFKVFSTIIAAIALLLGVIYIILGVVIIIAQSSIEAGAVAGMYFLYGSLAAYFGMKDFVSCIHKNS